MKTNIKTIKLGSNAGNCYLIKTKMGFILIATGEKINCKDLAIELSQLACTAHNLNLIIFTHKKSFNNANYICIREKFKAKIAMHILDEALIDEEEHRSFFCELVEFVKSIFSKPKSSTNFKPDFIIDEGTNLSHYGLNARVLFLPGHSNSIGILTEYGELFCDDIITNIEKSCKSKKVEILVLEKLKKYLVDIIYTSHGKPFQLQALKN